MLFAENENEREKHFLVEIAFNCREFIYFSRLNFVRKHDILRYLTQRYMA